MVCWTPAQCQQEDKCGQTVAMDVVIICPGYLFTHGQKNLQPFLSAHSPTSDMTFINNIQQGNTVVAILAELRHI